MKIEVAKQGKLGPSKAKWGQTGQNRAKCGHTGPNVVTRGQMEPYGAKQGQTGKRGLTGPNRFIWNIQEYFYEMEISYLASQTLRQKLAELWGFC